MQSLNLVFKVLELFQNGIIYKMPNGPQPILMVTRNYPPGVGGIETMSYELSRRLDLSCGSLILLHLGPARCRSVPENIQRYFYLPAKGKASTYTSSLMVLYLVWKYKPGIIFNLQVTTSLGSWLGKKFFGARYIIVGLGLEVMQSPYFFINKLKQVLLQNAEKVISISRFTNDLVSGFELPPSKLRVLPLGADPDIFFPVKWEPQIKTPDLTSEKFVLLSVSRLVQRKGLDTVIEAMSQWAPEDPDVIYLIGGRGPDESRLQNLVAIHHLEDRVLFLGELSVEELRVFFSRADVFVMPSRETQEPPEVEGFGLVFLEAAACGTPSIGSYTGGIPDAVEDGETGYLVPPDDVAALMEKLLFLKERPEQKKQLGEAARRQVLEKKNWSTVCEAYWKEVLENNE